jgi:large subunit ribosomal protein L32
MPVPKTRKSKSKRDMRRANHDKLTPPTIVACANCGEPSQPHRVCGACGFYKGREVIAPRAAEETAE